MRRAGEVDAIGVGGHELGAEALGLLAEAGHELRAHDAFGEAGVVLDVGGEHQLAAGADAFDDHRLEVGARRVHRRGESGRAGSDDDDVAMFSAHFATFRGDPAPPVAGAGSRVALDPQERPEQHEDSAEREPRRPDLALVELGQPAEQRHDEQHGRGKHEQHREQPEDDGLRGRTGRYDRLVTRGAMALSMASAASVVQSLIVTGLARGFPGEAAYMPRASGLRVHEERDEQAAITASRP